MFKIEYLSRYNISFRVGVLCLHWNPIEIKPRPNIRNPKKWAQWCYIFYTLVNIEWLDQLILKIQNCNIHALICKSNIFNLLTVLVFHLCVFLPCYLTSWIFMTVTRDNYQLTVVSMLAWNRKVSDMINIRYHLFCSRNAINLLGDVSSKTLNFLSLAISFDFKHVYFKMLTVHAIHDMMLHCAVKITAC